MIGSQHWPRWAAAVGCSVAPARPAVLGACEPRALPGGVGHANSRLRQRRHDDQSVEHMQRTAEPRLCCTQVRLQHQRYNLVTTSHTAALSVQHESTGHNLWGTLTVSHSMLCCSIVGVLALVRCNSLLWSASDDSTIKVATPSSNRSVNRNQPLSALTHSLTRTIAL